MIALGFASLAKSRVLSRFLGHPANPWRWSVVLAALPTVVVGWLVTRYLPEWVELALGIPAILATYCWVIWVKGVGPEDRVLFRRNVGA